MRHPSGVSLAAGLDGGNTTIYSSPDAMKDEVLTPAGSEFCHPREFSHSTNLVIVSLHIALCNACKRNVVVVLQ